MSTALDPDAPFPAVDPAMSQTITIACPACGAQKSVGAESVGQKVQCECGMSFSVSPVFAVAPSRGGVMGGDRRARVQTLAATALMFAGGAMLAVWLMRRGTTDNRSQPPAPSPPVAAAPALPADPPDTPPPSADARDSQPPAAVEKPGSATLPPAAPAPPPVAAADPEKVPAPVAGADEAKAPPVKPIPTTEPPPETATGAAKSPPPTSADPNPATPAGPDKPAADNPAPSPAPLAAPPAPKVPEPPPPSAKAEQFWDAFDLDPDKAKAQFVGRTVDLTVRGQVERDAEGKAYFGARVIWPTKKTPAQLSRLPAQQRAWERDGYPANVRCYLAADQVAAAEALAAGTEYVIRGECAGRQDDPAVYMGYVVVLRDCRVVK
jgi:hypothetical protein